MIRRVVLALCGLLILLILLLLLPVSYQPPATPRPSQSYEESLARFAEIQASEAALNLFDDCASQLLHHGQPTTQVMVLFHGYRSCPRQLAGLGTIFYEQGYNVFIPRVPHMGLADLMSPDQVNLTADELSYYGAEAVDIAQGLGDQVTLLGISMGGVVTGWQAQSRSDVDLAVLVSPAFGLGLIPPPVTGPAVRLFGLLPNRFLWQNAELQMQVPNPPQVYPRNATRPISAFLRYGFAVRNASRRSAPAATAILVVTNGADRAVSNETTAAIVEQWRSGGYTAIETYEFTPELQLDHDLLDPDHPKEQVEIVYPIL
ncbi:MAG: alpha/beta fold hydrolase, partial [Caldilineaceae bacterium]|nr:alpha/beta fold hydrolase [Caldilineaceae bacterium]